MLKPYYVISPEYASGNSDVYEPPDYGCDVAQVEARTKREAIILGVKWLLKNQNHSWAETNRSDEQSPFAGYRAELARCGHGNPHFVVVGERAVPMRCWGCEALTRSPDLE